MPIHAPDSGASEADWNAFFEGHGEPKIRHLLHTGGWPQQLHLPAIEWLARRETAGVAVQAAENSRLADAASRSAAAAERQVIVAESANRRSSIALVLSAVAVFITLAGVLVTHWDALRSH